MTETLVEETPAPTGDESGATPAPKRRRWRRRAGTALIVLGLVALLYGALIYFWRDPVTDLYARVKQHQLAGQLDTQFEEFRASAGLPVIPVTADDGPGEPDAPTGEPAADPATLGEIERLARRYERTLELGDPMGRIVIPRLGLDTIFVNGTRWGADLSRGPGRYPETSIPGLGTLTAIAGHRTTFGAPFRHIDDLQAGDLITLELPYGTFTYRVFKHEIVDDEDWSIIRERGFEMLVLSACHPLYSASQRWIVDARLVEVTLPDGQVWTS